MTIGEVIQFADGRYFKVDGFSDVGGCKEPYGCFVDAPAEPEAEEDKPAVKRTRSRKAQTQA